MKYDAFISYRHSELDLKIAKKIHGGLEKYRIPKAIQKKIGKKRINRVFRDQEELPIGSDLTGNISAALEESEYLIVVCSPRTPESEWVVKEIETFISLHGRDNVLAALIEGEPNESFPHILLENEEGEKVEPLAADLRGSDDKEVNQKFRTEIIRLAAAVLGCSYDDLKQRHRERVVRRTLAIVSGAAAVIAMAGVAFGIYNARVAEQMTRLADEKAQLAEEKTELAAEKTELADEILSEYAEKQKNQSRYLAAESLDLLEHGNVEDAVLVAKAALPSAEDDRPYVPEAEYALGKALHAYETGSLMDYAGILQHNKDVDEMEVDSEGRLVTFDRSDSVYVWDIETQKCLAYIPYEDGRDGRASQIVAVKTFGDKIAVCHEYDLCIYNFEGELTSQLDLYEELSPLTINACVFSESRKTAYLVLSNEIRVVNIDTLEQETIIENPYDHYFGYKAEFSDETGILALNQSKGTDVAQTEELFVLVIDVDTKEIDRVFLEGQVINNLTIDDEGHIAVVSFDVSEDYSKNQTTYIGFVDGNNKTLLWKQSVFNEQFNSKNVGEYVRLNTIKEDNEETRQVVVVIGENVRIYDSQGNLTSNRYYAAYINDITFSDDGTIGLLGQVDGTIDSINMRDGSIGIENYFSATAGIRKLIIAKGHLIIKSSDSNVYLVKSARAFDLEELFSFDNSAFYSIVSDDGSLMEYTDSDKYYVFYDCTGNEISRYTPEEYKLFEISRFLEDNTFLFVTGGGEVTKFNPENNKEERLTDVIYTIGIGDVNCEVTENDKYLLLSTGENWVVISLENMSITASGESEEKIRAIDVTEDATKVFAYIKDTGLTVYDIANGTETIFDNESLEADYLFNIDRCSRIELSPNGKYGAILCGDRHIRIFNTSDGSTVSEISVIAVDDLFMKFSQDSANLVYQCDDLVIHNWNIAEQEFSGYHEAGYAVRDIEFDRDHQIIGAVYSSSMDLLDYESFTVIAEVKCKKYIPNTGEIIALNNKTLYSLYYKDYKALLKRAEEEYGDCELTDEEKREYLID